MLSDAVQNLMMDAISTHRIAYELIDRQMVPFESKQMHETVVASALRLLAGRAGWEDVEAAYQDALAEIADNGPADAIAPSPTQVGRSQEALGAVVAKGNALGPAGQGRQKQGILGRHDETLTDGIAKIVDWVSADRSERSEAHKSGSDDRADAWLAVHVVGALILRLADSEAPRDL